MSLYALNGEDVVCKRGYKPTQNVDALCAAAAEMLKKAGFELRHTSRRSEACYYALPGRDDLIRVAAHKWGGVSGLSRVSAKITFSQGDSRPGHMKMHPDKVRNMVAQAIGFYMMKSKESL